jgi:tRNA G18 (ribose-2'-O)-methylase SpoU
MNSPKKRTTPDWSVDSPTHKLAMEDRENHLYNSGCNVIDEFKSLSNIEIKSRLAETKFPYAVCMENWINDYNFACAIRNANAFNAKEIFYIGDKKYDRRAATGAYNYIDVSWIESIEDFIKLKNEYIFIGIDNVQGSISMYNYKFQKNSMLIFGSEGTGLTRKMISICDVIVHIPMYGSVRSLNAATASGILMNKFISSISE